jgi:hypothetical protein
MPFIVECQYIIIGGFGFMKGEEVPEEYVDTIRDNDFFEYISSPNWSFNFDNNSAMAFGRGESSNTLTYRRFYKAIVGNAGSEKNENINIS